MEVIISERKNLSRNQKLLILELWNKEYPEKISLKSLNDFEKYLKGLADKHHILISDENKIVKGWLVYFIRDKGRWFAMLLDSSMQGKGFGSKLLNLAKEKNSELNGWVIDNYKELKQNGEIYSSPVAFYLKNEFKVYKNITAFKSGIEMIKVTWKR